VVAPPSADAEVAARQAFAAEAEPTDQPPRARIRGLDVRLQPVQAQRTEGASDDETEALGHVAASFEGREEVVAEIGALEGAADDLHHVDDADQLARRPLDEEVRAMRRPPAPTEPGAEGGGGAGRLAPRPVEVPAPSRRFDEPALVARRRAPDHDRRHVSVAGGRPRAA
jgi:hypothetical protein